MHIAINESSEPCRESCKQWKLFVYVYIIFYIFDIKLNYIIEWRTLIAFVLDRIACYQWNDSICKTSAGDQLCVFLWLGWVLYKPQFHHLNNLL